MADSKIPVEIEVRLDERSVGVSMESLKSRVKAQGREIGQGLGKGLVDSQMAEIKKLYSEQMRAHRLAVAQQKEIEKAAQLEIRKIKNDRLADIKKLAKDEQAEARKAAFGAYEEQMKAHRLTIAMRKEQDRVVVDSYKKQMDAAKVAVNAQIAELNRLKTSQMNFGNDWVKWLNQQHAEALRMNKDFNKQQAAASMFVGPQLPKSFRSQNLMTGVLTGNTEATRTMAKLHEQALMMNSEFGKTPPMLERINRPFQKIALLTTELTRAFFGLSLVVGAVGLPAILGGRYLSAMETAQNGMAGILVSMAEADGRTLNFAEASKIAADNIAMLGKEAVRTGNDSKALIDTFRSILAPGLGAGMDIDQIRQVAIVGGAAVKAIGLPVTQQIQEIRDLVAGGITPASSTLATALGLKDKDIKEMRESAEGLFVGLMNRLKGFAEMTDETFKTLSGKITIFGEVVNQTMAKSFVGTFDSFKNLVDAATSIFGEIDRKTGGIKFNDALMEDLSLMDRTLSTILDTVTLLVQKYAELGREKVDIFGTQTNLRPWVENASGLALFAALARDNLFKSVGAVSMLTKAFGVLSAFLAGFRLGDWAYENFEIVRKFGAIIVGSFVEVTERATQIGNAIQNLFGGIVASIGLVIDALIDTVVTRAKSIPDMIKMVVTSAMSWIASGLEKLGAGDFAKKLMSSFTFSDAAAKYDSQIDALAQRQKSRAQQFSDVWSQAATNIAEVNIESANKIDIAWGMVSETQSNAQVQASRKVEAEVARVAKMTSAETSIIVKAAEDAAKKLNAAEHQKQFYEGLIKTSKDQLEKLNTILANPSGKSAEEIKKIRDQADQLKKVIPEIESGLAKMMNKEFSKSPAAKSLKDALKDAIDAYKAYSTEQDTLVQEGAVTFAEAYNNRIKKIDELSAKTMDSSKWGKERADAEKIFVKHLTEGNEALKKEIEQIEESTRVSMLYGESVKGSAAALAYEKVMLDESLSSHHKAVALIHVELLARKQVAEAINKMHGEYVAGAKQLEDIEAEGLLMFMESEKQKIDYREERAKKMLEIEKNEALAALDIQKQVLDATVQLQGGQATQDQLNSYTKMLESKATIEKLYTDRSVQIGKIASAERKNAELKDAKETVDKIEGTFKEAFMNIAKSGTSGWRSMLDKFKSDFKKNIIEYIYKELAKPFVLNVIAQVTGAMGMSGVSQAASRMAGGTSGGGFGNLMGTGSTAYSMFNTAATATGISSLGSFGAGLSAAGSGASGLAIEGGLSMMAEGEIMAGMMQTLGAAAPWIAAGLIVADAVGLFGEGGGPQQGQYGSLGSEGYKSSFTMSGGDALGNQALAEVAYGQAATLLKMAGKDIAGLTIGQGYKLDPEGSAAGLAYRNISLNGRTITGGTFDGNNGAQWVGGSGDAEGAATYLAKLTSSEIEAIANTLNDAKLNGIIASLKKDFDDLADGMARYQTAQALQKGLLGAILSDEEKQKRHLAEVTEYLNKAFADINMAVPTTTEEFRKLIDGVDLTTVAGQTLLTQLGAMGDSFLFVVERAKAAQAQQEEYTNRLAVLQGTTTEQRLAREKELAGALTDGNKAILNQIYALEDHNAIIEKQKEAYQSLSETITTMVDAIKAQNGALKASQSGWQREYGGVDVQGAAERVAAAMGMSAGSVRGMSEADLRSLALSQSQTTTTTDKYADVSKEAMTEALRSGFMATSDALADAVRGGVLFDKLPALLDPFLKPLALNTDDAFQYVANHILSSWDAIMGDGGSGAGKTLAEIVDQFVQGQDLPTSHRVLAGKETTSNFDKLKQDWDDLIAAAAESAKAGAEAAGRVAEEAKKAADAAAAAAKEAEDAFRQLAESVESVFQKYQDNIKKSRIDGMTSQEKVSYFTNQSAQALAALSGGTIQDSETLLKLHDDYIESVMNQYGVELEALEEQFKVTTDLLQTVVDIKGWLDKIKLGALSPLNPQQKLEESRRQYETTLAAAQGGDIAARQNLTAVAEEYLNQAQSYYASSEDYANIFTNVLAQIGALSEPTKTTAEILAQIEGQDKLFNTQANALRERMIVALETGQNRLVDALGSMKADFIAALGQASALAKAASAPPAYASQPYSTSDSPAAKDLVLAAVSSINPGFDYAGAAASNPALIEAWGKDLGIPGYAKGGLVSPGWAMVGEQGPELINFSQPGRVYTADQTSAAINGGNEEYLQQVISELQALIRQNGAASQAMIAELQAVKAELEDLRARTRLKEAA